MNRFKKEIRKKGFKLENDYEMLPLNGIMGVTVDTTNAMIFVYYTLTTVVYKFYRNGKIKDIFAY